MASDDDARSFVARAQRAQEAINALGAGPPGAGGVLEESMRGEQILDQAELSPRERVALQAMLAELLDRLVKGHKARKRLAAGHVLSRIGQREVVELDGTELGTVAVERGAAGGWAVTDEQALLEWVQANDAAAVIVERIETYDVGAAYRRELVDAARKGELVTVQATGEMLPAREIPGIGVAEGRPPKLVVRPAAGAEAVVLAHLGEAARVLGLELPEELEQ